MPRGERSRNFVVATEIAKCCQRLMFRDVSPTTQIQVDADSSFAYAAGMELNKSVVAAFCVGGAVGVAGAAIAWRAAAAAAAPAASVHQGCQCASSSARNATESAPAPGTDHVPQDAARTPLHISTRVSASPPRTPAATPTDGDGASSTCATAGASVGFGTATPSSIPSPARDWAGALRRPDLQTGRPDALLSPPGAGRVPRPARRPSRAQSGRERRASLLEHVRPTNTPEHRLIAGSRSLRQVIVVLRHGARLPNNPVPADISWPCSEEFYAKYKGTLSPQGVLQHINVGNAFREKYVTGSHLFDGIRLMDVGKYVLACVCVQATVG